MNYLVDADVLSEATKPVPSSAVLEWLQKHDSKLIVNPIILGELEYGILLLSPGRRRKRLQQWFVAGMRQLNVVEIGAATATVWATLLADLKKKGRAMPIKDSLIAASAREHDLTIATRNTADFRHAGVPLVDPFNSRKK